MRDCAVQQDVKCEQGPSQRVEWLPTDTPGEANEKARLPACDSSGNKYKNLGAPSFGGPYLVRKRTRTPPCECDCSRGRVSSPHSPPSAWWRGYLGLTKRQVLLPGASARNYSHPHTRRHTPPHTPSHGPAAAGTGTVNFRKPK